MDRHCGRSGRRRGDAAGSRLTGRLAGTIILSARHAGLSARCFPAGSISRTARPASGGNAHGGRHGSAISAALGEHWIPPSAPRVWSAWGYLVVFGSIIAFSAYRFLVERVVAHAGGDLRLRQSARGTVCGLVAGRETFSQRPVRVADCAHRCRAACLDELTRQCPGADAEESGGGEPRLGALSQGF